MLTEENLLQAIHLGIMLITFAIPEKNKQFHKRFIF